MVFMINLQLQTYPFPIIVKVINILGTTIIGNSTIPQHTKDNFTENLKVLFF